MMAFEGIELSVLNNRVIRFSSRQNCFL